MKKLFFVSITLFFMVGVKAQIQIGVNANYVKFSQTDGGQSFYGPGLNFAYIGDPEGKMSYFGGVNYFLPSTTDVIVTGLASSNFTSPNSIDINSSQKTNLFHARAGVKYLFVGDNSSDLGVYGGVEGSFMMVSAKYTLGNYDETQYNPTVTDGEKSSGSQLLMGLGLGVQKLAGPGHIFAEGYFRFPATSYNSRSGYAEEISVPKHLHFSVGYKITLGGE